MKKMRFIISTTAFLISFLTYSQHTNSILGFACGSGGRATKSVTKVYNYVTENKYNKIIKLLYSKNPADKFLAVLVCEKLAKKRKITLTQRDLEIIKKSYSSDELVNVCTGCTFQENMKMSLLLNAKEDLEHIREEGEEYFKDVL